jgi:hypothetical protein
MNFVPWLPGIFVAMIGIIPGMLAWRQAARVQEEAEEEEEAHHGIDRRRVEHEAYKVAESIWKAAVLEAERQAVQSRETALIREHDLGRCQRRVDSLIQTMRSAGVPIPEEEPRA